MRRGTAHGEGYGFTCTSDTRAWMIKNPGGRTAAVRRLAAGWRDHSHDHARPSRSSLRRLWTVTALGYRARSPGDGSHDISKW
jgi:hypothetical protein